VRAAAAGESALAPTVAARLMERMRAPRVSLSSREIEVLQLVADGASNVDVAARLHITDATVKSHLVHVFSKLGVASRTAAVREARSLGVLR
jgi:ATP/maltotriose-dependent transcriptional regulator MalT